MYEYLLEGIAWSLAAEELERLEVFARAHFTGAALEELRAAIARQRIAIDTARKRSPHAPARVHRLPDPLERMMDEIAAASSVAEIDHLRREVDALFATHPRRCDLDAALDGKRRALSRSLGT